MNRKLTIGLDAKRIVRNGTGLGSYGRTLANDLACLQHLNAQGDASVYDTLDLRLYAPDPTGGPMPCFVSSKLMV